MDNDGPASSFPYPPYDIQQQFMINVVDALEQKQIGLFESPTGTGKTLSVICSTLYWLEAERARAKEAAAAAAQGANDDGLPDWLAAATTAASVSPSPAKTNKPGAQRKAAHKATTPVLDDQGNDLSEFLPTGATQGGPADSASPAGTKRSAQDAGGYNSSSSSGSEDEGTADAEAEVAAAAEQRRQPQVIFCSRTHSQLSQFVSELHRTRFASSIQLVAVASRRALCVNDKVRQLSELSQINERCLELQRSKAPSKRKPAAHQAAAASSSVLGFAGAARQQQQQRQRRSSSGRKASGCPYLSPEGGSKSWDEFRDSVLSTPMDVEELASLGSKQQVCPYYGSRKAVPAADVVLAPYSAVLMPDARDSLGIQLQDAVLVFDEAHNLLNALNSAHSTAVTAWQLLSVQRSLTAYYERFKGVLNPTNAQNIQRLLHIAAALHNSLQQQQHGATACEGAGGSGSGSSGGGARVMAVNDLLFDLGLEDINMFDLARWVKDNKMAFKVSGYTAAAVEQAGGSIQLQQHPKQPPLDSSKQQQQQQHQQQQQQEPSLGQLSARDGVSAIHAFMSFLLSLTHADEDGRVILEPPAPHAAHHTAQHAPQQQAAGATTTALTAGSGGSNSRGSEQPGRGGQLRYVLLNAARHFGKLLASARSVLLVSGTLAPIEGLAAQLFPDVAPSRIRHFECAHVVPAEQLLTVSIGRGPGGRALNLKHESRGDAGLMQELGQVLVNLCAVVPQGLVVFVPSFGYLEQLVGQWQACGVWGRLNSRKQVFREPRAATEVEAVLSAYAACINGEPPSSTASQAAASGPTPPAAAAAAVVPPCSSDGGSNSSSGSGALMLCVVGGKLSEGINFGDGLGRCVVVVGLPYPNRTNVELQARMQYLDKLAAAAASRASAPPGAPAAAAADTAMGDAAATQQQDQQRLGSEPGSQQQQQQLVQGAVPRRTVFQVLNQARPCDAPAAVGKPPLPPTQPAAATAAATPPSGTSVEADAPPQQHTQGGAFSSPTAAAAEGCAGSGAAGATSAPAADQQQDTSGGGGSSKSSGGGSSGSSSGCGSFSGRDFYEDLCFKAVNQCVGRVVRHRGDYAAVVLLDTRWVVGPTEWAALSSSSGSSGSSRRKVPVQKLPGWLQRSFVPSSGDFGPALKQLAAFFKRQQAHKAAA